MSLRLATSRFAFAKRIHDIARPVSLSKPDPIANPRPPGEAAGVADHDLCIGHGAGCFAVAALASARMVFTPAVGAHCSITFPLPPEAAERGRDAPLTRD